MNQTSRRQHPGFTLVELVLVMIIVGVISAIALPRFAQANARQQLAAAAKRVASDLENARHHARATSNQVMLSFDTSESSYTFKPATGDAYTVQLGESPYAVAISKSAFDVSSSVVFNGFGIPSDAGQITLQSSAGTAVVSLESNGSVSQ